MKIKPRDYQAGATKAMLTFAMKNAPDVHAFCDLPTGSGKSVVIADFCEQLVKHGKRVLVLCRQGELVQQNSERLQQMTDDVKVGIYSASLGRKDVQADVIFGTVQSVVRNVHDLGRINCILIDECHQIPAKADSQYGKVINKIREYQPKCRVFGLTATAYRTGSGLIYGEGKVFDECCYSVPLQRMLDDGHITPWSLPDVEQVDVSGVRIKGGEYDIEELSDAFLKKVDENISEMIALTEDRKRVLVFATSIAHAHALQIGLGRNGKMVDVVTGDTHKSQRESILRGFCAEPKRQRFLINVGVLTTGFDAPNVDAVAICRATKSAGLFYQILGRGMRKYEGKHDFLVLDFGGNFEEHGDPTDPNFGRSSQEKQRVMCGSCKVYLDAEDCRCPECKTPLVFKDCLQCGGSRPSDETVCQAALDTTLFPEICGFDFTLRRCRRPLKDDQICLHPVTAEDEYCQGCQNEIEKAQQKGESLKNSCVKVDKPKYWWNVEEVSYTLHQPKDENKQPSLRVTYKCLREEFDEMLGQKVKVNGRFMEWVCFEHEGFAKNRAIKWWNEVSTSSCPDAIIEAEELIRRGAVREPFLIMTQEDGKWQRIIAKKFNTDKPERVLLDFEEDDDCPF